MISIASLFGSEVAPGNLIQSIFGEMFVLFIFFVTWVVTSKALAKSKKTVNNNKEDIGEVIQLIQDLAHDQFSKAMRMYRDLIRRDLDRKIKNEEFFHALVDGGIRTGQADASLHVLQRMMVLDMKPSTVFLQNIMRLLCARKFYSACLRIYDICEPEMDTVVYSCLTQASGELGDVDKCKEFLEFREGKKRDLLSKEYLPLLRAYARKKNLDASVKLLRWMMQSKPEVDTLVVNTVLSAGGRADPKQLAGILKEVTECQHAGIDIVTYNTVMKCFARHREVTQCFSLLEEIRAAEIAPDDVTFSTLLDVCIDENEHQLAQVALEQMQESDVKMNCVLLTTLMKGFVRTKRLDMAMNLYHSMYNRDAGSRPDMVTYSLLIKAQCDAQDMSAALSIFEDMLQHNCKVDDVVFTHLIEGCCHVSNPVLAERLFQDMLTANIKPTIYTMTALVKVYGKCGQSEKAAQLVNTMEEVYGIKPTVVVKTCLISGLLRQHKRTEAYAAFQLMQKDGSCEPDAQSCQTMITGLCEGQMWGEVIAVVQWALKKELRLKPDVLNNALQQMLPRSEIHAGQQLYQLMMNNKIAVTVPSVKRRLNIA